MPLALYAPKHRASIAFVPFWGRNCYVMSLPICNMLPSASTSINNYCTTRYRRWPPNVQCHRCNNDIGNHHKVQCQSRRRKVKLKSDSSPMGAAERLSSPSTTAAAILGDRLDRCDALRLVSPTKATMGRSNQRDIASDCRLCHRKCTNACFNAVAANRHEKSTTINATMRPVWPRASMTRTFQIHRLLNLFTVLCLCFTVISASRFIPPENELPPYSQYYPSYLPDEASISLIPGQNRLGKSNSRTIGKSPAVNPNDAIKQFLEPSFSGGEISGYKVLRRTQNINQFGPDYRITSDIVVPQNAKLEIEPGVRIAFAARTGITIRGALLANVSINSIAPDPRDATSSEVNHCPCAFL